MKKVALIFLFCVASLGAYLYLIPPVPTTIVVDVRAARASNREACFDALKSLDGNPSGSHVMDPNMRSLNIVDPKVKDRRLSACANGLSHDADDWVRDFITLVETRPECNGVAAITNLEYGARPANALDLSVQIIPSDKKQHYTLADLGMPEVGVLADGDDEPEAAAIKACGAARKHG